MVFKRLLRIVCHSTKSSVYKVILVKKSRLDKYGAQLSSMLTGKGKKTNLKILEELLLNKETTMWQLTQRVFEAIRGREPSYDETRKFYLHKPITKFKRFGYVEKRGSTISKGNKVDTYGLSLKGCLTTFYVSEKARANWQKFFEASIECLEFESWDQPLKDLFRTFARKFIEYGATQRLFLRFWVDPNERLLTSIADLDSIDNKTFRAMVEENIFFAYENPMSGHNTHSKNLTPKEKNFLSKLYQDPTTIKITENLASNLERSYQTQLDFIKKAKKRLKKKR